MFNLGKLIARFLHVSYDIYLFIPHMNTGGAEQVHLATLRVFKEEGYKVATIVTSTPENSLHNNFKALSRVFDIRISNKVRQLFFLFMGLWSTIINKQEKAIVIGSHSYFFYRLIPFLNNNYKIVDVIHSLESGQEMRYGELFNQIQSKINHVLCVDESTKKLILKQSKCDKVDVVNNPTYEIFFQKGYVRDKVHPKVVFVGRYAPVKRPQIIEELAAKADNIRIGWIGELPEQKKSADIHYEGLFTDREELAENMNLYDFLLITSESEAFPMVIQEAMALGMIVISTNVGGISTHISHKENGILIDATDESMIRNEIQTVIQELCENQSLACEISKNAINYARSHFSFSTFRQNMMNIL